MKKILFVMVVSFMSISAKAAAVDISAGKSGSLGNQMRKMYTDFTGMDLGILVQASCALKESTTISCEFKFDLQLLKKMQISKSLISMCSRFKGLI